MNALLNNRRSQASTSLAAMALALDCLLARPAVGQSTNAEGWLWMPRGTTSAPVEISGPATVWTGSQMLIWGHKLIGSSTYLSSGYRYNAQSDSWSPMSLQSAPTVREWHTAIWTGREMIIWGGAAFRAGLTLYNTGGRYDPVADKWYPMTTVGAPRPRHLQSAVWTGKEMLVWGGGSYGDLFNDGGRYDPVTDSWKPITTAGAPTARTWATAVWTGKEMLVWGGYYLTCHNYECENRYPADFGRYDPVSETWNTSIVTGAPTLRAGCTAIWDGREMIVWGGYSGDTGQTYLNTGGRFNPASGSWTLMSTNQAPVGRNQHVAVWTGHEMIVWGGVRANSALADGGRYNPVADTWRLGTTNGAPISSLYDRAVWTGEAMLVFKNRLYAYYEAGAYAWDGLPDDWQRQYFGENNALAAPLADSDGDGQNNQLEYVAGTVPTNASSQLEFSIQASSSQAGSAELTFKPWVGGRIYSLLAGTNLSADALTTIATALTNNPAESGDFTVTNTMKSDQFFRLQIGLP